ncbi:hypothetical protein MIND_01139000 [Mycena indigotica]|uniref:Uncharacterized protein n=1 Tax=Mycena indigotica TaxID=2126181 RepID=A0A8H6S655_9AGAR|nr:uncharacterized protein MIND_01139000 [Mycena indigotica]KAF7293599.1 hypothetical protein MIND_01139000 [Mycena indigotica]
MIPPASNSSSLLLNVTGALPRAPFQRTNSDSSPHPMSANGAIVTRAAAAWLTLPLPPLNTIVTGLQKRRQLGTTNRWDGVADGYGYDGVEVGGGYKERLERERWTREVNTRRGTLSLPLHSQRPKPLHWTHGSTPTAPSTYLMHSSLVGHRPTIPVRTTLADLQVW